MERSRPRRRLVARLILALLLIGGSVGAAAAQQAPSPPPCIGYSYTSRRSLWIPADIHRVVDVLPGSPAEAAGLREGDVLLSTGGVRIGETGPPLVPGESTILLIERDGREIELRVVVGERVPDSAERPTELVCRQVRRPEGNAGG